MSGLTLGSLFDGIGVFPLAASRCGIHPLWASEIEAAPISITRRHFPDMAHLGDITKLDGGAIPPVHVLTFGSPCQNLSQIGRREGLDGAKSGLFFHAIRIIQEMRKATNDLYPVIATTYIRPYKVAAGKTVIQTMGERFAYGLNPKKLGAVSAYLCDPASAPAEFLLLKSQYQAETGRAVERGALFFQIRQAFPPGEKGHTGCSRWRGGCGISP